jgi:hypothetical protein
MSLAEQEVLQQASFLIRMNITYDLETNYAIPAIVPF